MSDSETESDNGTVKDTSVMGVEKEESSETDETHLVDKSSAQSDGIENHMAAVNSTPVKDSVPSDGFKNHMTAVNSTQEKDSAQSDGMEKYTTAVNSTPERNSDHSEKEGPKSLQDGIMGDEGDAETGDPQEDMKKADGGDLPVESYSLVNNEEFLESQTEGKMAQELQNGVTEELYPETEIHVETLENGDMRKELLTEDEENDNTSSSEESGMELCHEDDLMEEVDDGTPEMDLPQDVETRGEELGSMATGMDLPSDSELNEEADHTVSGMAMLADNNIKDERQQSEFSAGNAVEVKRTTNLFLLGPDATEDEETGTEEEQLAFMKELETFHKEKFLEFKPPRFYGEPLNLLKLWRAVIRLGGYEQVTSCKYWRQVGESFKPPKTCTTVSWTFRCFYEKALQEYEKHKMLCGELPFSDASFSEPTSGGNQPGVQQALGSGRARRDAAARAMQGWHSHRNLGNGEVGDAVIKDKNSTSTPKREKTLKTIGLLKRKRPSPVDRVVKAARFKVSKPQSESDTMVVDVGPPADWVKINVQRTKDCFELYALVPGLLREEVRVQSDPAGRLVITGQPEQLENPWGVTPFKKVVTLPSRIDPHQTSAVVTLHGQLFVRIPFEQSDM